MGAGQTYPLVFARRLITGVCAVLFNAILDKMVADWFVGKAIVTVMGVILISWPVGIALGLVVQSAVADVYPWPTVMYLSSGACAVAFALVIALHMAWSSALVESMSTLLIRSVLQVSAAPFTLPM